MIVKYRDSFRDDWQDEVRKSGVLYHDIRWRKVIKNTYGLRPEYYVNIVNGRVTGGFPAFRIMGKLVSLPHLNYCGEYGNFPVDELQSQVKSTIYIKKILLIWILMHNYKCLQIINHGCWPLKIY